MSSRKLFALCLSVFLFCGLSGLAQAADQTADRDAAAMTAQGASSDRTLADQSVAGSEDIVLAGLFTKKEKCFEVYVKTFKGKEKRGTAWALDCKAAQEAVGLDVVLKMGATCTKTKAKSSDECY